MMYNNYRKALSCQITKFPFGPGSEVALVKKVFEDQGDQKAVTIYDIAQEAGVSISTVSRVLNDSGYVGAKTRRRILNAIRKFDYLPNATARSMVNKKSATVGVIVPEIDNPFFAELFVEFEKRLDSRGYMILLCNSEYSIAKEEKFVDEIISRNADGLILLSSGLDRENLSEMVRSRVSVVSIESTLDESDRISVTNWKAAFEMTEHLISLGHSDIAFLGALRDPPLASMRDRLCGYQDALAKHGLAPEAHFSPALEEFAGSARDAALWLLRRKPRPTAIFAINDNAAFEAYGAVEELGLRVGADVSVAGFDNVRASRLVYPKLTTIDFSTKVMVEIATDFLLKRMRGEERGAWKEIQLPTNLVVRDSTKAPRR